MKFRNTGGELDKIEPQMAPMIDIVFQLLIFFMLTLKIIEPEGDFSINMRQGKPTPDPQQKKEEVETVKITMRADTHGALLSLEINVSSTDPLLANETHLILRQRRNVQ